MGLLPSDSSSLEVYPPASVDMLSSTALPAFARVPRCCSASATACAALLLRASSSLLLEEVLDAVLGAIVTVRAAADRVILTVICSPPFPARGLS